jgi:uncharacterized protein
VRLTLAAASNPPRQGLDDSFSRSRPEAEGHRPDTLLRDTPRRVVEPHLPPGTINGLWFYSGIASLLLGSRLLNPYFTPPGDAATNAFVSCVSILAAWEAAHEKSMPVAALYWAGAYCVIVFLISIISLLLRPPLGMRSPPWLIASERFARALGAPNVIFTVVIVAAVWVFHRTQPLQVFAILTATLFIVAFAPIDRLLAFISWLNNLHTRTAPEGIIGLIAAHQSPGIVLIRQTDGATIATGCPLLVCDDGGPHALGLALNYVGRDEGNLLRVLTVPVPAELATRTDAVAEGVGTGVAVQFSLTQEETAAISADHAASIVRRMDQFCGMIDPAALPLGILVRFIRQESERRTVELLEQVAAASPPVMALELAGAP